MKCPKCGNKDEFKLITWEITSHKSWVCLDSDGKNYQWEESKTLDIVDTGIYPESDCLCEKCEYEGPIEEFDDGNLPTPIAYPVSELVEKGKS